MEKISFDYVLHTFLLSDTGISKTIPYFQQRFIAQLVEEIEYRHGQQVTSIFRNFSHYIRNVFAIVQSYILQLLAVFREGYDRAVRYIFTFS